MKALIGLAMFSRVLPRMACRNYASLRCFFLGVAYFFSLPALAIGLGDLQVQSSIGQNLKVAIPLLGQDSEDILPSCVRGRIFNLDGSFISNAQIQIGYDKRGKNLIAASHQTLSEPALSLQITIECGMRIERTWQLLLDMPSENIRLPYVTSAERAAIALPSESKAARKAARAEAQRSAQLERTLAASKPVAATVANSAQSLPSSKNKRKAAKKQEGDVLRVSKHSDAELAELHRLVLLMSGALSADSLAKVEAKEAHLAVPQVSAEMRAAQELAAMQQKIRMLEAEENRLQLRSSEQDRQLQGKPAEKNTYFWLLGLGFMLLAALLAIAWLLWRMQQLRQGVQSAWHAAAMVQAPSEAPPADPAADPAAPLPAKAVRAAMSAERSTNQPPAKSASVSTASAAASLPPNSLHDEHEDFFLANFAPAALDEKPSLDFASTPHLRDQELEMPTVAEVTDAMHEAEFWMSLGKPEKAAEVLELYSRADHPTSPVTWLYLFELYRSLGEEDKYAQLRTQFQRRFNAQIPAWDDALADPAKHGIESQQILLSKICMLWGASQLIAFLEDLIIDNREGMRTGFALPTYRDLLFLLDLAHTIEDTKAEHAL